MYLAVTRERGSDTRHVHVFDREVSVLLFEARKRFSSLTDFTPLFNGVQFRCHNTLLVLRLLQLIILLLLLRMLLIL